MDELIEEKPKKARVPKTQDAGKLTPEHQDTLIEVAEWWDKVKDPELKSPESVKQISEMITWWKAHKDEPQIPFSPAESRPRFIRTKNETMPVTFRLGTLMVEKARAAAVDPKNLPISTGSLNGLVEWLIWKFLNEPGELLAPTPTPKAKTGDGSE